MPSRRARWPTGPLKATVCTSVGAPRLAMSSRCRPVSPAATAARPRASSPTTSWLSPLRSISASRRGLSALVASTMARPWLPVATSTLLRDCPSTDATTATALAVPCRATWPTTPVAARRPSSGFRPCCTSAWSVRASRSESVRSMRVPITSSATSARPSPSVSRMPPRPSGSMKAGITRMPSASSGRLVRPSEANARAGMRVGLPDGALWLTTWAMRLLVAS